MQEFEIEFLPVVQEIDIELKDTVAIVYPELEDLEVTPLTQEQIFKPDKYGYSEVVVKPIITEEVEIVPTEQKQTMTGLFDKVIVNKIPEDYIIPTVEGNVLDLSKGAEEEGVLVL